MHGIDLGAGKAHLVLLQAESETTLGIGVYVQPDPERRPQEHTWLNAYGLTAEEAADIVREVIDRHGTVKVELGHSAWKPGVRNWLPCPDGLREQLATAFHERRILIRSLLDERDNV